MKKGRATITCISYGKYKYVSRIKVTIVSPVENVVTEDEIFIKKGQKINWTSVFLTILLVYRISEMHIKKV